MANYRDVQAFKAGARTMSLWRGPYAPPVDLSGADLSLCTPTESWLQHTTLTSSLAEHILAGELSDYLRQNGYKDDDSHELIVRGGFYAGVQMPRGDLTGTNLSGCILADADLSEANLTRADLSGADLSGADLSSALLVETNLSKAKLNRCRVYGVSAWKVNLEEAEQRDLIITPKSEPDIAIDNLSLAQFIYLLLRNAEIRAAIDTITSKVVLLLGRFSEERKTVLDTLRHELRLRNYVPVMFDFERPAGKSYTETITTLARMARFIVADITDATEVRSELMAIVPSLPSVPVRPIILASRPEYVTFSEDFRPYPWVLQPFRYASLDHIVASLPEILAAAEAKVVGLRGRATE